MTYEVSGSQRSRAKAPHELFLINLIFNHILVFVTLLGLATNYPQGLLLVPVISFGVTGYILWRANRAKRQDPWFVNGHWQIAARRSRLFMGMLLFMAGVTALGWAGYTFLGMMKVAVYALIGGMGMFPTMIAVLVLILLESESMHQARHGQMPSWIEARFPDSSLPAIHK